MPKQHLADRAPRPFVKWAGGKRRLIPAMSEYFPREFGRYFEPFLGGGAVLFYTLLLDPGRRCLVSDLNADLILAYTVVRDRVDELIESLRGHAAGYAEDRSGYYYRVRGEEPSDPVSVCSRLVFLNRTCFNGLYRVNRRGKFNVPMGRYANPNIVNEEGLRAASRLLGSGNVRISSGDFADALAGAGEGDFVYLDPPYQPVSATASFTQYTGGDFVAADLERLASEYARLDGAGCRVVLSNSDTEPVRRLFGGWNVAKLTANRLINSDSSGRSGHHELLIRNF